MIALVLVLALSAPPDLFQIQTDLQGLYDEISQAALQFASAEDADQFHSVLYTPDWTFVDAAGQHHSWPEIREQILHAPLIDSSEQPIKKLTLVPGGAITTVNTTVTRDVVDTDGKYGKKGESHAIAETIVYRDTWVEEGDRWKLKLREQQGPPKIQVDPSIY
jgi:hypothetical protein